MNLADTFAPLSPTIDPCLAARQSATDPRCKAAKVAVRHLDSYLVSEAALKSPHE